MNQVIVSHQVKQRVSYLPKVHQEVFREAVADLEQGRAKTIQSLSDNILYYEKSVKGLGFMEIYLKTAINILNITVEIIDFRTPEEVQKEKIKDRIFLIGQNQKKDWFKEASHWKLIGNAIGTLFVILITLGQFINFENQTQPKNYPSEEESKTRHETLTP